MKGEKNIGRSICRFDNNKPVLLIIGGSQGSIKINETIRGLLSELLKDFNVCHICGKGNLNEKLNKIAGYTQFEYVGDDLPHLFALSDLVISRAGATVLFELLELKKPHILIPLSKNASRGDQLLNAQSFENQGYSIVLQEEQLNKDNLLSTIKTVIKNKDYYIHSMQKSKLLDSINKITDVITAINS